MQIKTLWVVLGILVEMYVVEGRTAVLCIKMPVIR